MRAAKQEARSEPRPVPKPASRMGTPGSKQRPQSDARRSILASADRLFYNDGIGAVGVDAVAQGAGVTKRTLYYHFASKEDLIAAYLDERDKMTLDNVLNKPTDAASCPGDRVIGIFDFVERWSATPDFRGCPFNNAAGEQSVGAKVTGVVRRHKATVRKWFARRAAEGGASDPDEVGAQLLVLLDGALNGAGIFRSPEPVVAARMMAEMLLDAAGVSRSRRAPVKRRR